MKAILISINAFFEISVIVAPPTERIINPFRKIAADSPQQLDDYLALFSPTDDKDRYLHYDQLRFRLAKDLDPVLAWSIVKLARRQQAKPLLYLGHPQQSCVFTLTPTLQKTISATDRQTTSASLSQMLSSIGEHNHLEYLLNGLVQDEAINSSQLEGAATTTQVAKDLLKRKRSPRTLGEKMIVGNFNMMRFAWKNRHQALSLDLLRSLHQTGVEHIDNDQYRPGLFRDSNDVVVVDAKGNTLHTPPPATGLSQRLQAIVDWANVDHHDEETTDYIHPLVKAISLHFTIGYEHPFRDGNGRVARALFYWYLFKNDFTAFRYIAISTLLKAAPVQYGKSYLYTETDEMDLTYFIDYQCKVILRAIATFQKTYRETIENIEEFDHWLQGTRLDKSLSKNQKVVFQFAEANASQAFTTREVQESLGCSYNTAATVLNGLVELNLFKKEKAGREWLFSILSKDEIQKSWKTQREPLDKSKIKFQ